jgi:ABC-type transporter Mla subunit MlaD
MDDQQAGRVNETARQFAEALMESFRAVSDRTVATQQLNVNLAQDFFNRVVDNLRTQAEDTRQMTQQLADQQQRAQEATQELTRESVSAYMDFANSMFTFYQGSVETTQRGAEEAERSIGEAERSTTSAGEYFSDIIMETNRRSRGEA